MLLWYDRYKEQQFDWMCLGINSKGIVVIYLPIMNVLTGVDSVIPGYVSSQVVINNQHSAIYSYVPI